MRNLTKLAAAIISLLAPGTAIAVPVEWALASGGNGHFYDYIQLDCNCYDWHLT